MAERAILYITNATNSRLMPEYPVINKLTYICYQMDMWWFSTIGPLNYKAFEVRFRGGKNSADEDDAGLMLFKSPGGTVFVLEALSDATSRHYMQVQSQTEAQSTLPSTYVIATCIDAAAHAVPDPIDLHWHPIVTLPYTDPAQALPNNTGIPIGYPTSYLLPATEKSKQSNKNGENSKNTTSPPVGYPNGYIEQDGMLFGLALVDLAALFSDSKTLSSLQDAINNYSLSYTQARLLQTTLRTTIMPPASTTPPSTTR